MNIQVRSEAETEIRSSMRPANLKAGLERLSDFAERSAELGQTLEALAGLTGKDTTRAVERLRRELNEFEPTITILGQVKSGKTTLVNAMAGWADLLPSDVNPWTSVVTSLHLKPAAQPAERGAKFRFMTESDWDRLLNQGGRIGELASRAGAESELKKISDQIDRVIRGYLAMGPDGRRNDPRIGRDRHALIMSGAAILQALLRVWPTDRLSVADRGLREGLLYAQMSADGVLEAGPF